MRAVANRRKRRAITGIAVLLVAGLVIGAIFIFGSGAKQAAASKSVATRPTDTTIQSTTTTVAAKKVGQAAEAVRPFVPDSLSVTAIKLTNVAVKPAHTTTTPDPFLGGKVVSAFPVPANGSYVVWWQDGPAPGSAGLAVLLGHNEIGAPGVFNNLGSLKVGQAVSISGQGHSLALKVLARPVLTAKSDASALDKVLSHPPKGARLALVSCAGTVNQSLESHNDNITVFAG